MSALFRCLTFREMSSLLLFDYLLACIPSPKMITQKSQATPLVLALLLAVLCLVAVMIISWRHLSHVPGPFSHAISYWPMFRTRCSGSHRACIKYTALSDKYGELVRIGPRDLLTSDPELVRRMSAARSIYNRSSWYKATRLDPYHDMMGSVLDKSKHHSLRIKLRLGYLGKDIPNLEATIDAGIAALVRLIRQKYVSSRAAAENTEVTGLRTVNFGRLADYYAMDARSRMSFGQPVGLLENDKDVYELVETANMAIELIQIITDIPPLQLIASSNLFLKLFGPKPTDKKGFGKIMGIAREYVAKRFDPDAKDEQDLLGSFLRHGLDRRSAESEVLFPMIAGSDTSAKAIKRTVYHVVSNPRVYEALNQEIKAATLEGRISRPVTYQEAQKLPYLQAVVYEGLRVEPPFTGLIMKEVGAEGDTYKGMHIPAGTRIGHNTWSITHDKRMFGDDADDFRPERWLEADDDKRNAMNRQTQLVFGSGRWECAGKAVAFLELNKLYVELFRTFYFESTGHGLTMIVSFA